MVLKQQRLLLEGSAILASALALFFAGCGLFSSNREGFVFNHKVHAEKGLTCDGCHEDYEYEPGAGMPAYETCLICHGPKDDEPPKPFEAEIQKHEPDEPFVPRYRYYDLKFSHALHSEAEIECSACHGDVENAEDLGDVERPEFETCKDCHVEKEISLDCAVCHQNLRKDVKPRTHGDPTWMRIHGRDVSVGGYNDRGHGDSCTVCHTQSSCDRCHRQEKPLDHTEFFRIQGHGAYVSMDRDRCMACHQESYCVRCHREAVPRSHMMPSWGGTTSNHCLYCHEDEGESGCRVCHYGPSSHSAASPLPPPPHPGPSANCYACHPRPPHGDNGGDCTACHRR